jgi:hypothetical protein
MITFYRGQDVAGAAAIRMVPFPLDRYFYCHPKGLIITDDEAQRIIKILTIGGQDGRIDGRYEWRRTEPPSEFAIDYVFPYTLEEVLWLLNEHLQRATYGAVGDKLGIPARFVMNNRPRNHSNCWVVDEHDELPTGYLKDQKHPDLLKTFYVVHNLAELQEWLDKRRQMDYVPNSVPSPLSPSVAAE